MDTNKGNVKSFLFGMLMANQNNIDESVFNRTYLVTAKYDRRFINKDFYQHHVSLEKLVYLKIVSSINPDKRNRGSEVASILIGADVEATRINRGNFFDPEVPHFHAFLVISHEEYENYKNIDEILQSRIRAGLETIREIIDISVHIEKYDPLYGKTKHSSLNDMFSYVYKGYDQANRMDIYFPFPSVFPYQLEGERNTKLRNCSAKSIHIPKFQSIYNIRDDITCALMAHHCDIDAFVRNGFNNQIRLI